MAVLVRDASSVDRAVLNRSLKCCDAESKQKQIPRCARDDWNKARSWFPRLNVNWRTMLISGGEIC